MPAVTTRPTEPPPPVLPPPRPVPTLHLALDLGNTTWQLAFATGIALAPRLRTTPARDLQQPPAIESRRRTVAPARQRSRAV